MNYLSLRILFAAPLYLLFTPYAIAANISFGNGINQFNIDFVEIGSPGNAADTSGNPNPSGAVLNTKSAETWCSKRMPPQAT
jgi:hypothetical protein